MKLTKQKDSIMKMTRRDFLKLSSAAAVACGVTLLPAEKAAAASEIGRAHV